MIGSTIGPYTITGMIGSSGMGEVFVGEDVMLERRVAIKQLRPALASQPDVVARFHAEAVLLARLQHPNIATVYALLREGTNCFLVMEYVQGWTLQHILHVRGAFAPVVAGGLFQQALDGIGYAHRRQIIHRDLKPANIMLTEDGVIKVMDFGVARVVGAAHVTQPGRLVGTVAYLSPEHIRGEETDSRSDIYSLGVMLYELVTNRVPFASDSDYAVMRAHLDVQPPSPRQIMPTVSAALAQVILRALSKAPTARFQSTEDFSQALARCLPQTETHTAVSALLTALKTTPGTAVAAHLHSQETQRTAPLVSTAAECTAPRHATRRTSPGTGLRASRPLRTGKRALGLLLLASSVTAAGSLLVLGVPSAPSGGGLSPRLPDALVSPATIPLPGAPQAGNGGGTSRPSASADASVPPEAAALPREQPPQAAAPKHRLAKASRTGTMAVRAARKGRESPLVSAPTPSIHEAPAPSAATERTEELGGWYIRK